MADLNFPKDRTELVPPSTGPLQTGDTYTANGTTWVYDATAGAWGSGKGSISGGIYLSKINNDTAAGEITFEKLSTHESGISVTGESVFNNSMELYGQATFYGMYNATYDEHFQVCELNQVSGTGKFARKINPDQVGNTSGAQHSTWSQLTLTSGGINSNLSFSRPGAIKAEVKFDDSFVNTSANNDQRIYGVISYGRHAYKRDDVGLDKQAKIGGFAHFLGQGGYAPGDQISFHSDIQGIDNVSLTAFRSEINKNDTADNYSFYAAGTAPNYFKGNINCDGLINGAFSLRMETDNPAAFQTTYSIDDDGNQVENQIYTGTTEDLLSIIKDLRARLDALEGA